MLAAKKLCHGDSQVRPVLRHALPRWAAEARETWRTWVEDFVLFLEEFHFSFGSFRQIKGWDLLKGRLFVHPYIWKCRSHVPGITP